MTGRAEGKYKSVRAEEKKVETIHQVYKVVKWLLVNGYE
jgi:hypothetical protein